MKPATVKSLTILSDSLFDCGCFWKSDLLEERLTYGMGDALEMDGYIYRQNYFRSLSYLFCNSLVICNKKKNKKKSLVLYLMYRELCAATISCIDSAV